MNVAVGIVSDTAIAAGSVIMRQINMADTSLRLDDQRPVDSLTGMKGQISAKLATFIKAHLSTPFSVSVPAPPLQNSDLVQTVPTFAEQRSCPTCPTFAEHRSCPTCPHLCRIPILSNLSPPLQNTDLVQPGSTQSVDLRETLSGPAAESLACLRWTADVAMATSLTIQNGERTAEESGKNPITSKGPFPPSWHTPLFV